jgi:hypothetical protein
MKYYNLKGSKISMQIDASHWECRPSRLKNRALCTVAAAAALVFFLDLDVDQ